MSGDTARRMSWASNSRQRRGTTSGGVAAADDPATVVQRFNDVRNSYDVPGTLALVTDDIRNVGGPRCTEAAPYIGAAAFRLNLEGGFIVNHVQLTIIGTPQVSGTTVRLRQEVRGDIYRAAGIERIVTNSTVEVRDGKIASTTDVPDASDAQTAQFLAYQRAQQSASPAPPRTGGGGEASFNRRLGDG